MGKKTKETSVASAPTVIASEMKKKKKQAPAAPGNVRHRKLLRHGKLKMYAVGRRQAKRLALRADEGHISIKAGIPQFLTLQVHHMAQSLGLAARGIADCRKRDSTVRESDMKEAIRILYHQRIYTSTEDLAAEKRARRHRAKRMKRELEQKEKKRAEDAATSEAANA